MTDLKIRPEVARRLGYYVYLYIDPRTRKPFYVGKGKGARVLAHLSEAAESRKTAVLAELRAAGLEPQIDILAHALPDERTAFLIEAAVIDVLRLDDLTNKVRGVHAGRLPLSELTFQYAARPCQVRVPALLIRINRLYRHDMPPDELYEATRGVWKLSARRHRVQYAFAVFEGVVREVYAIDGWHPAGSTVYETRDASRFERDRWEFTGTPAEEPVRSQYYGRSVVSYFRQGLQTPTAYVNC